MADPLRRSASHASGGQLADGAFALHVLVEDECKARDESKRLNRTATVLRQVRGLRATPAAHTAAMRRVIVVLRWVIRMCAIVQLTLGSLFWSRNAPTLIPLHMLTGLLLVLGLWTQAALGARAGLPIRLLGLALGWGVIVVAVGLTQDSLLPGDAHWVIQVVHLLIGLTAVGLAEAIAARSLPRVARPAAAEAPVEVRA
jgi:hypothetical protein